VSPNDFGGSREGPSPWLPVTLLTIAIVAWFGFQTYHLVRERFSLEAAKVAQEPTIEQANKLRAQLDAISKKMLELAQQGNAGATLIVEELAKRGIRINPTPPPAPVAPAPSK
jgi:hypothetical protein